MNKDDNDLLPVIVGIMMSWVLIIISIMFSSFVNMYVWNNVLLYFFELPLITLVGGFGIEVLKDAFAKQIFTIDKNVSAYERLLYSVSFRATVLLLAWIFTLLV